MLYRNLLIKHFLLALFRINMSRPRERCLLTAVMPLHLKGWPTWNKQVSVFLQELWQLRHSLSIANDLVMSGDRSVIPEDCWSEMLKKRHTSHQGSECSRCVGLVLPKAFQTTDSERWKEMQTNEWPKNCHIIYLKYRNRECRQGLLPHFQKTLPLGCVLWVGPAYSFLSRRLGKKTGVVDGKW